MAIMIIGDHGTVIILVTIPTVTPSIHTPMEVGATGTGITASGMVMAGIITDIITMDITPETGQTILRVQNQSVPEIIITVTADLFLPDLPILQSMHIP